MPGKSTAKLTKYDKFIEGSDEDHMEVAEFTKDYIYKILNYAETDEPISPEEYAKLRMYYQYAKQGPRAFYNRFNKRNKMTSADIIYILVSTKGSYRLSKEVGIDPRKIREIRSGQVPCWEWEYTLIKKIRAIVTKKVRETTEVRNIYAIQKLVGVDKYEILGYFTSNIKARKRREKMLTKPEYRKLTEEGTLDIYYPIKELDLL